MGARGEGSDVTSGFRSDPAPSSPAATASTTCSPRATAPGSGGPPTRSWPAASPSTRCPATTSGRPRLLDAARVSATVTDPHLLRVLDCDDEDGITWVVNEWGDGVSLDLMLQQGTLPPSRAAWLTREVADAIAAGHAQGVAHGRLNPEAVLVTQAGAVKLIGYVVDASLQRSRPPDPLYGELDDREADVINLAGILYAGADRSVARRRSAPAVPTAPREGRRPLRPRQVRAGVPRTLDVDLRAGAAQGGLAARDADRDRPRDRRRPRRLRRRLRAWPRRSTSPACTPSRPSRSTATRWPRESPTCTPRLSRPRPIEPGRRPPRPTQLSEPPAPATSSRAGSRGHADVPARSAQGPDTMAPLQAPSEQAAPPPPFEDPPERPLFASTERRVPAAAPGRPRQRAAAESGARRRAGATATAARGGVDSTSGGTGDTGSGFWPFTDEDEAKNDVHTGKEGRGWLRMAIVVGVLLVVVVAMAIAFNRGRQDGGPTPGSPSTTQSQSAAANAGAAITIAGVTRLRPRRRPARGEPRHGEVTPSTATPATSWTTAPTAATRRSAASSPASG